MRHSRILPLVGLLALTSSCAWYRDLERSLVEDDQKKANRSPVSREQYDQLLVKYEELSKKYEELKEGSPAGQSSLVDELQRTKPTGAETETVDIFAEQNAAPVVNVPKDIDSQLNLYRRATTLRSSNPSEATKIFQQLENQGIPAIKARSKLQIGEMLIEKQQYDLALQVFEDIIGRHAHSGVILDALKYATFCSDKLGINNKKEQYASMLNDVFEATRE